MNVLKNAETRIKSMFFDVCTLLDNQKSEEKRVKSGKNGQICKNWVRLSTKDGMITEPMNRARTDK